MARVTGSQQHSARLNRMANRAAPGIVSALYAAGQMIEIEAEISITNGSVSGKGHVPSLPGQPPNADTRLLDTSIETTIVDRQTPRVNVTSNAPYSAALEYGTAKMAERPFMRPAVEKRRGEATRLVGAAIDATIRRST